MKINKKQIENFLSEKDIIVKNEIFKEEEKDVYSLFLEGLIEEEALEKTTFEQMKEDLDKLTILEKLKTNVIKEFKFSQIARSEFNEVVDYYLRNALKNLKKKENLSNKFSSGDNEIDLNELSLIDEEEVSFTENDDPFTIEVKKSKLIARAIDKTYGQLSKNKHLDNVLSTAVAGVRTISSLVTGFLRFTGSLLTAAADTVGIAPVVDAILGPSVDFATTFSNVFTETVAAVLGKTEYVDGVSETPFGEKQELSWKTFISKHVKKDQNVSFEQITPYDEIGTSPIILGLPPKFMKSADPNNRTFINTFMKDGIFVSFIPGKPKYNGSINKGLTEDFSVEAFKNASDAGTLASWTDRWETFKQKGKNLWDNAFGNNPNANPKNTMALKFLKENGISSEFNSLDKRYYSFEADYIDYYSYLETMLNAVYVKMGLANNKEDKLKLFSFFDHSSNFASASLKAQYNNKSIGFYCNGKPSVNDNVTNSISSPDTADQINQTASEFQKLNYLTGFGAGTKKKSRDSLIKVTQFKTGWNLGVDILGRGGGRIFDSYTDNKVLSTIQSIGNKVLTPIQNISNNDYTVLTDALFTHNGMKVVFPNLWSDSNYSKSVNLNFEFVSPYGDPLSIFKYVYVPFLSLLALSLPRQASDNAYVNPSFVRVDVPGFITSDFAIISDISWTKGGDSDAWTVDRLPRSITVNVTIEDLYLYMAMTKRLSYLPSNPNYSIFLDTFSGFRAKDVTNGSFSANQSYWEGLINRLNVSTDENKVWNKTKFDKMISDSSWLKYEQEKVKNNKRDIHWIKDEN